MPQLAIAGLVWLGGVLASFIGQSFAFFAKRITWQLALLAAVVASMATLTGAMMLGGYSLIQGLMTAMPSTAGAPLDLFLPTNTGACLGAIVSVDVMRWVYDWRIKLLTVKLTATG